MAEGGRRSLGANHEHELKFPLFKKWGRHYDYFWRPLDGLVKQVLEHDRSTAFMDRPLSSSEREAIRRIADRGRPENRRAFAERIASAGQLWAERARSASEAERLRREGEDRELKRVFAAILEEAYMETYRRADAAWSQSDFVYFYQFLAVELDLVPRGTEYDRIGGTKGCASPSANLNLSR